MGCARRVCGGVGGWGGSYMDMPDPVKGQEVRVHQIHRRQPFCASAAALTGRGEVDAERHRKGYVTSESATEGMNSAT